MNFEIDRIVIRMVRLPEQEAFTTSFGTTSGKTPLIVEVKGAGISGWGEGAVPLSPYYNHETPQTALHVLRDFAIPLFVKARPANPTDASGVLHKIVGNPFAKSSLEMAYWDWHAKAQALPLYRMLGGTRQTIPVGVSIGIQKDLATLVAKVGQYIEQGYQRIKIKISPGNDIQLVQAILKQYPHVPLMVDANSAYSLADIATLRALDQFPLMMIEQPLREGDLYEHSLLQRELRTPICLDESISCVEDMQAAIALGSCRIVNIKPGRVGGLAVAKAIHDCAAKHNITVWCGGMLESGIGRAANMALATLPNFTLPGDISESKRYYKDDFVDPEIVLGPGGTLALLDKPGIGFGINLEKLSKYSLLEECISIPKA